MVARLTKRQRKIFELCCQGCRYREIGDILGISRKSVERRVAYACKILGAETAIHAVAILFRARIFK